MMNSANALVLGIYSPKSTTMIAVITSIELKSPFKYFPLIANSSQIVRQLQKSDGCIGYKFRGIWTKHYTITCWETHEQMGAFAKSGSHLQAMGKSKALAKEIRTYTYETDTMPNWKEAKALLREGKVLSYE